MAAPWPNILHFSEITAPKTMISFTLTVKKSILNKFLGGSNLLVITLLFNDHMITFCDDRGSDHL